MKIKNLGIAKQFRGFFCEDGMVEFVAFFM